MPLYTLLINVIIKNKKGDKKEMEKREEGSGNLYKKSLNGMLGPGDVDYDEEGFVVERGEENMRRKEEFARENPWLEAKPDDRWLGEFGEPKGAIPLQMYD